MVSRKLGRACRIEGVRDGGERQEREAATDWRIVAAPGVDPARWDQRRGADPGRGAEQCAPAEPARWLRLRHCARARLQGRSAARPPALLPRSAAATGG